ncbi:MAG: leucine--tRNA ligase [Marmoricola sp.]|nr:leucine--tRNA ligase [Marmoricola sp.]
MQRYNPKEIEPRWQQQWKDRELYKAVDFDDRPKFVMLTEFPYPSGDGLHLGHTREYTLGDIIARHKRMLGMNVLYPMGFDAFGLPTENYAIKNKIAPQVATDRNVATFQQQFEALGYSIDWSRSFKTTDPDYYRWTQWLFLQFYKAGLAYQDEIAINWCPHCKTGLANEEVVNGRHERCDTLVEKKFLKQWLLGITQYADRLIDGLADVDYPSRIADQQINWIGRSKGAEVEFRVAGSEDTLRVFTTRPDTLFGATFMVLAPEHPLVQKITTQEQKEHVNSYIKSAQAKTDIERQDAGREKTGVATGAHAINPVTGKEIPVWIADYVLTGYGTGAIMAVPAHDDRDWAFAEKYSLPVIRVVKNEESDDEHTHAEGVMMNSGNYDGMPSAEARDKIVADLAAIGLAGEKINYRLRDWIFSRQHYWGEPIPIIHCAEHGAVPVPEDQLPVELPPVEHYEPTDTGESPLAAITDWVNTTCPVCGEPAKRETDTMPNWAGSSWYYMRYFDAHNNQSFADRAKLEYWKDVDLYLGGMEHTTLHLLYSRFWHQFLYDQGLVPTPEPYKARRGQGIVLAADGSKMSKSKGNVVNPNEVIDSGYGADALRLAIAFLAPYDQTTSWSPESVAGTFRFLQRIWTLVQEFNIAEKGDTDSEELLRATHKAIKKVTADIESMSFNTAIAGLMELTNELFRIKAQDSYASKNWGETLQTVVKLIAPFAPHITEELWMQLGQTDSVHTSSWPKFDHRYLVEDTMTIVIQVNGKLRGELTALSGADETHVIDQAKSDERVRAHLEGTEIRKTIYVPGRLVNFVVS